MGQHVWLLLATILTELLVITKWSKGQFPEPLPRHIRWAWTIGGILLVLYPTFRVSNYLLSICFYCPRWLNRRQFGVPSIRKYVRKQKQKRKVKGKGKKVQ